MSVQPVGPSGTWTLDLDEEFASLSNWNLCDGWTGQNGVTTKAANVSIATGPCTLTLASSTSGAQMILNPSVYQMAVGDVIEAYINFPGSGTTCDNWPAWWATSTGSAWAAGGEADIFEVGGSRATINYHDSSGQAGPFTQSGTWAGGFHTYTLWRQKTQLLVYWDGVLKKTIPTSDTGVAWSVYLTHGYSSSGSTLSVGAQMVVQYVRAWSPASGGGGGGGGGGTGTGPYYADSTVVAQGTRTNTTYAVPTGTISGDTLLLYHWEYGGTSPPPTPSVVSDWALVPLTTGSWPNQQGDSYLWVWWRTVGSSGPTSYTVSHSSTESAGALVTVRGADPTTPITAAVADSGTGGTTTFLSVTTSVANELILAIQADNASTSNTLTAPTGTTPTFTANVNTPGMFVASGNITGSGTATGSKTMTNNAGTGGWDSIMLAMRPPGGGPTPVTLHAALAATAHLSATLSSTGAHTLSAAFAARATLVATLTTSGSSPVAPNSFSGGIRSSMVPWAPAGSDFDKYNMALGAMFETVFAIVADQGSPDEAADYRAGWSLLLDPANCAAMFPVFLPWLGLFVGAGVPVGAPAAVALQTILGEQGFARGQGFGGSYDSTNGVAGGPIVTAAQSQLGGTQSVNLIERINAAGNLDPYHFVITVTASEVVDANALTAAVNAVKPAGVTWTLVQTSSWTISELEAAYTTISSVESAFASITALEGDVT